MVPLALANRFEGVLTGHQDPWWSPALGAKDAGLAIDLAATHENSLPATNAARRLYEEAATDPANHDIADVTRATPADPAAERTGLLPTAKSTRAWSVVRPERDPMDVWFEFP